MLYYSCQEEREPKGNRKAPGHLNIIKNTRKEVFDYGQLDSI